MRRLILVCGVAAAILGSAAETLAATITVSVDGQAEPWRWEDGGLNTAFQYGVQDGIDPTIVDGGSGLSLAAGTTIDIAYLSGLTNAFLGGPDIADALGYPGFIANDSPGSTGEFFPSLYMSPYPPDKYLNALVGTFADGTGAIVGSPFHIGYGGSFVVPVGAARLQLGLNDDLWFDNTGALSVCVSDSGACASVPEPITAGLLATGLAGLAARRLRRRRS